jgi:hypothetical protein
VVCTAIKTIPVGGALEAAISTKINQEPLVASGAQFFTKSSGFAVGQSEDDNVVPGECGLGCFGKGVLGKAG